MRHCSVQVRGLLVREELERYNALIQVGQFLESIKQYDFATTIQQEIDWLIQPAIERLKDKGRHRDRLTAAYLAQRAADDGEEDEDEDVEPDEHT